MGLPAFAVDAAGCARLEFDGRTRVNFEVDTETDRLQLYSVLGPLPGEGREALYRTLLEGNLFGGGTRGASLAVDSLAHEVVLCQCLSAELYSGEAFIALLEDFVTCAQHWTETLQSGPAPTAALDDTPAGELPYLRA